MLRLIARGLSNGVARELVVGDATVKTHVGRIFAKLDRAQAVVLAYETGLVQPGATSAAG